MAEFSPPHERQQASESRAPGLATGGLGRDSLVDQTFALLLEAIRSGQFAVGQRLPSEHDLAGQLRVSRATVREALGLLQHQGRITRRSGDGTYVTEPERATFADMLHSFRGVDEIAAAQGVELSAGHGEIETQQAGVEIATRLGLAAGEDIHVVTRTMSTPAGPAIHMVDVVPAAIISLQDLRRVGRGVIRSLLAELVPDVAYTSIEISAAVTDPSLASALDVPAGTLVLISDETVFTADDRPVEASFNYYNPSRVVLKTVQRRISD